MRKQTKKRKEDGDLRKRIADKNNKDIVSAKLQHMNREQIEEMKEAQFGIDGISPLREITQASLTDLEVHGLSEIN